jgi:hypothetical protein
MRFVVGEAIPPAEAGRETDETCLRRLRREVEGALQELIDIELARRAGIDL